MSQTSNETETHIREYFRYMFWIPIMENNQPVIQSLQFTKQTQQQKQEKYTKVLNALGTILYNKELHTPQTVLQNVRPFFENEALKKQITDFEGYTLGDDRLNATEFVIHLYKNVSIEAQCVLLSLIINDTSTEPATQNLDLLTKLLTMIGNDRHVRFAESTKGAAAIRTEGAAKGVSRASNLKSKPQTSTTKETLSENKPLPTTLMQELTQTIQRRSQTTPPPEETKPPPPKTPISKTTQKATPTPIPKTTEITPKTTSTGTETPQTTETTPKATSTGTETIGIAATSEKPSQLSPPPTRIKGGALPKQTKSKFEKTLENGLLVADKIKNKIDYITSERKNGRMNSDEDTSKLDELKTLSKNIHVDIRNLRDNIEDLEEESSKTESEKDKEFIAKTEAKRASNVRNILEHIQFFNKLYPSGRRKTRKQIVKRRQSRSKKSSKQRQ
jgi:hypothetical protein